MSARHSSRCADYRIMPRRGGAGRGQVRGIAALGQQAQLMHNPLVGIGIGKKDGIEVVFFLTVFSTRLERRVRACAVEVSASADEATALLSSSKRLRKRSAAFVLVRRQR